MKLRMMRMLESIIWVKILRFRYDLLNLKEIKDLLDREVDARNCPAELSH